MADTPKSDLPIQRPSLRPLSRVESVAALLEEPLKDESKVLDSLVTALGAGEATADLFKKLHEAATAQERSANLSFAYDRVARDNRLKLLPKPKQAEFLLHAATFFGEVFGDVEAAIGYAERAQKLAPEDPAVFDHLETLYATAQQGKKLAKLYTDGAARQRDVAGKLRLLRAAVELLEIDGEPEEVVPLYRQIFELDPTDAAAEATLDRLFVSGRRFRELAELLERSVARAAAPPEVLDDVRLRLIGLYRGELRDPTRAAPHVEALLSREPIGQAALQAAEALVDHRPVAQRIAPLLSEAYRRLGRLEEEAGTLTLELKLARPPRIAEVHRRLATLRQDVLGDPAGALELLEPLVARDPADEELRRRYLAVSATFHREVEAAKLLSRALTSVKDAGVRVRIALEIATLYGKQGENRRARALLEPLLDEALDDATKLAVGKRLVALAEDGADPKGLSRALDVVVRLEAELPERIAAARRLVEIADGPAPDAKLAITGWRALVASPRAEEALDRLDALFAALHDTDGAVEVLVHRAARAKDPAEARTFALRALELRASKTADRGAVIAAYREFLRAHGPSRDVHARLASLLEAKREFAELVSVLEADLSLCAPGERAPVLGRIGRILLAELKNVPRALDAVEAGLALDPKEPECRRVAERLLAEGEHRIDAAGILEPVYRAEENFAGLVKIQEARAALLTEPARRLAALDDAFRIVESKLPDPKRRLALAGRALAEAARTRRAEVSRWLERFRAAAAESGEPLRAAELLAEAARDVVVDGAELRDLAREAAEALVATGEVARAVETYRRVLAFEPASSELLARVDELLAAQGSPEERLSLYESALAQAGTKKRRHELLHAIARLRRKDLADPRGAAETLTAMIRENPLDAAAHDALVDVLAELGDRAALSKELERALSWADGEKRTSILVRLARERGLGGDAEGALAAYEDLFRADALAPAALAEMEALAEARGEPERVAAVLERRVERSTTDAERAECLERLGELRARKLADTEGALEAFRSGARLSRETTGESERARRLYERVLDIAPEDHEAARFLVQASAEAGDFSRVPATFSVLLRTDPSDEPLALLLGLGPVALRAGAVDAFVAMIDEALGRKGVEARRARELLEAKARAFATDPASFDRARAVFRALVEAFGEMSDAEAFREFLGRLPASPGVAEDRRWLHAFRAEHGPDRIGALLEWARAEEAELGDAAAAVRVYAEILDADPSHAEARDALCRLQLERGDAEGLLRVLRSARERAPAEDALEVDLRIARLLVERLGRAPEALPALAAVLERAPDNAEALSLVQASLAEPSARIAAATLLADVAKTLDGPNGEAILKVLLAETRGAPELRDRRPSWYARLVSLSGDDPARALAVAVAAAEELPGEPALWDAAERLSRRAAKPDVVAAAYARALRTDLSPDVAEAVGRRAVEFHEEWFEDAASVLALLERVLELAPRARWALDRIKLSYNAEGRWEDLFALYDRAIQGATDGAERRDLLDEAAVAAKDLANDAERAVGYLERLQAERPDGRVESMLERLYERTSRTRELLALLERRAKGLSGHELLRLELRLARLRLDVEDVTTAFALLEGVLAKAPDEPVAYSLLERLVKVKAVQEEPPKKKKGKAKKSRDVRRDAVEILEARYRSSGDREGLARVLEAAIDVAESGKERIRRLEELVSLYADALSDPGSAFRHAGTLVALEPAAPVYRERLAELAGRTGAQAERAGLLARVAESVPSGAVRIGLMREAAAVLEEIGQRAESAALYARVLDACRGDAKTTLEVARTLEALLAALERPAERCDVLERLAAVEPDPARRIRALGTLAQVAFESLRDGERAIRAFHQELEIDPENLDAIAGLEHVLDTLGRYRELAEVLGRRASILGGERARPDRVRRARLLEDPIGDRPAAVEAWRALARDFGSDEETFAALFRLLSAEARWDELAELVRDAARAERAPEKRIELCRTLGDLHRDRTRRPLDALAAYVEGGDFARATTVFDTVSDREVEKAVARKLLELAVSAWGESPIASDQDIADAAHLAIQTLVRRHLEEGAIEEVVAIELRGAALPFEPSRRRQFRRDAAWTTCDRLEDPARAIEILKELFAEDPDDEIALASVTRFARLLDEAGRQRELAALWEEQGRCRVELGDRPGAAALFARAGEIWETREGDVERALSAHALGAAYGGEASLEALARIHTERKDYRGAAVALEWLLRTSGREALGGRALRLADAYLALGEWQLARARLEEAAPLADEADAVRARLSEIYRTHDEWEALAALLVAESDRARDDAARLGLLREAAAIHVERRGDSAAAVPLFERAADIDPDDTSLKLSLSEALSRSGRHEDAARVLREQIEHYGSRRPKDRAVVHLHLARVCLAAGLRAEALGELDTGAKINPAHPELLYELGRLALEEGQLARAERTYRALLLVLRKPDDQAPGGPGRAEIYLDLSEIAARQGEAERAGELVESAFEAALDRPVDAASLERALRKTGRYDLLSRALELRLTAAEEPQVAARALSDLVMLHAEHLGVLPEFQGRVQGEATRIHRALEAKDVSDAAAWAAMTSVYEWLGDEDAELLALERHVDAMLTSGSLDDLGPLFELAERRLSDPASLDAGVSLLARALDSGVGGDRPWVLLREVAARHPAHQGVLSLLERLAREPGREREYVEVMTVKASLGPLPAPALREAVDRAEALSKGDAVVALLRGALAHAAAYAPEDSAWIREALARRLDTSGAHEEALSLLEQAALGAEPERARGLLLEVARRAAAEHGAFERAARLYRRVLDRDPADRDAWEPLLDVYRSAGDRERLIALIEATAPLVESPADRGRLRLEEATVMISDPGRAESAVALLRSLVEEDPCFAEAADVLAEVLAERGLTGELVALLEAQLDLAKSNADPEGVESLSLKLGELFERQGLLDRAIDIYTGVLDWNASSRGALRALVRLEDSGHGREDVADAIERLLAIEDTDAAGPLAKRLVEIRTRQGDLLGVERALELACAKNPADTVLREHLVARCLERDDWGHAATVLFRAAEAEPEDDSLWLRAAEAYERSGDRERAIGALSVALSARPGSADLFTERARLLGELGRHDEALADIEAAHRAGGEKTSEFIAALEAAIARSSGEARAEHTLRLVSLYEELGETARAREQLVLLVRQEPKHRRALAKLASIASAEARWDEAAATYRRLIPLEEGEAKVAAAMNLADACELGGKLSDARGGLERALEAVPDDTALRDRLRQLYEVTGAHRELAHLLLREARKEREIPARTASLLRAAELLLEPDGDTEEAVQVLDEVQRLCPESVSGAVLLARARTALGRPGEAMAALEQVLKAHRGRRSRELSLVYREISNIHLEGGDLSAALEALGRAFDLDMRNGELAMQLGHLALDLDEAETAAKAFRSVTMMKLKVPGSPEGASAEAKAVAYYHLSRIAHAQGDIRKARLMATKAVSENPNHTEAQALLRDLRVS
jgi:tetratricopeptide (TPR) repeat protein